MLDRKTFIDPPVEYRGTDLWMMNSTLEEDSLSMQLEEMKKQGIGSFIARTYNGHQSDYPGEKYKNAIAFVIKKASELGLKVYLQAGYMPAGVPELPQEFALRVLSRSPEAENTGEGEKLAVSDGYVYFLKLLPTVLDILSPSAVGYYTDTAYDKMWSRFKPEFGRTVTSVWVDEPHLNPANISWSDGLPARFAKMWGYDITEKLGLLFDAGDGFERVRYQYQRCVALMLDEAYFTAVSDWCHANGLTFSGHLMGEDTLWYQTAYGASVMQHYKYFDMPGIDSLTGSLYWYHGISNNMAKKNMLFVTTPLQCSSAAHQAGKNEVLAEMYGVSTQDLGFEGQREIFDHMVSLGVNRKCIHALFSSLRGNRKYTYVPEIFHQQPYWNDYKLFTNYQARVSMFMREGDPVKDILVLHPAEDFFMRFNPKESPSPELYTYTAGREKYFNKLLCDLTRERRQFELGDEQTISECGSAGGGAFTVGEMSYGTVVVPSLSTIRSSTARLLIKHCEEGGKVVILGERPYMLDAGPDGEGLLEKLYASAGCHFAVGYAALSGLLDVLTDPDVALSVPSGQNVWMTLRRSGGDTYAFLLNKEAKPARVSLIARKKLGARVWNAADGTVADLAVEDCADGVSVPLTLEAGRSMMVQLTEEKTAVAVSGTALVLELSLDSGWTLTGKSVPNAFLLEYCSYKTEDGSDWSREYPLIAVGRLLTRRGYNGRFSVRFRFTAETAPSDASLVLENVGSYEASLNGKPIDTRASDGYYVDPSFERVRLGDALKVGENELILTTDFRLPEKAVPSLFALFRSAGGTELANLYIIGDFGVKVCRSYSHTGCLRIAPDYTMTAAPSDCCINELVTGGYPFYAGSLTFERDFELAENGYSWELELGDFRGCLAKYSVNGSPDIPLPFAPRRADVTPLLKVGTNHIRLTYINTLYNLLGPWHNPDGERLSTWQSPCWTGENRDAPDPDVWYTGKYTDTASWINDYHLKSQGISDIRLVGRR